MYQGKKRIKKKWKVSSSWKNTWQVSITEGVFNPMAAQPMRFSTNLQSSSVMTLAGEITSVHSAQSLQVVYILKSLKSDNSICVSKNRGTPKSFILIETIHFGVPLFLETPISYRSTKYYIKFKLIHRLSHQLLLINSPNDCVSKHWELLQWNPCPMVFFHTQSSFNPFILQVKPSCLIRLLLSSEDPQTRSISASARFAAICARFFGGTTSSKGDSRDSQ